jgi:hypothetical protein
LQEVILSDNQLTGTLPEWVGAKLLTGLWLRNNAFKGTLPASWGKMSGLQVLDLFNNTQLTGTLPPSWGNLNLMESLTLSSLPGITGTLPCAWRSMGKHAMGARSDTGPGKLARLYLDGSGLRGCYPSKRLKEAGGRADDVSYLFSSGGRSPLANVRGE